VWPPCPVMGMDPTTHMEGMNLSLQGLQFAAFASAHEPKGVERRAAALDALVHEAQTVFDP
jgi:hypothetical protein